MNRQSSRRSFLKEGTYWGIGLTGISFLLQQCGSPAAHNEQKPQDKAATTPPCRDYTGLTEDDLQARQKLGYVEVSPVNDRQCGNCNLWLPPVNNQPCGKCQLFKGPVETGGHCTYWVPMQQQPG